MTEANLTRTPAKPSQLWSLRSVCLLVLLWLVLDVGGLFRPGLLDDVDSIYIQIGREMLARHDFVTPTIDGIRFFDKPPLMYWMAAGSMRLFGIRDWAGRLPLALGMLALLIAVYALGIRLFRSVSPAENPDRAGFYAALVLGTCVGPYLYTRFYIPDVLVGLWIAVALHLLLVAMERAYSRQSTLWPCIGFGAAVGLNVLTKGLIGLVFPIAIGLAYALVTGKLRVLARIGWPWVLLSFLAIALPWHVLAALRNPAIAMPPGLGLPARAGWAWFYLYNEHIARFLGQRIPHDYGQVPIPLFWLLLIIWLVPWAAFLPLAVAKAYQSLTWLELRERVAASVPWRSSGSSNPEFSPSEDPALLLLLWAGIVLGFFTLSSRQEYYHLPAIPALALMAGGLLASAEAGAPAGLANRSTLQFQVLRSSLWGLVPLGSALFLICGYLALVAPAPPQGVDVNALLTQNPDLYNLSLGHVFDLTEKAMGFFRGPLLTVSLCMLALGPGSHLLRRRGRSYVANLVIAGSMTGVLLAAHESLVRFYPILGSKDLAARINAERHPGDRIMIDGLLTWGSTLLFYTDQPVSLVNGRIYGPWYGSFWPDAPAIFENDASLSQAWAGPRRIFLLTYNPQRMEALRHFAPVYLLQASGGKLVLTNRLPHTSSPCCSTKGE